MRTLVCRMHLLIKFNKLGRNMNKTILPVLLLVAIVAIVNAKVSTDKANELGNFAVSQMGPGHELVRVKSAKSQVVNGMMYHLTIVVREFKLGGFDKELTCHVKIWEQGYQKSIDSNSCVKWG